MEAFKALPMIVGAFLRDPIRYVRRPLDFSWTLIISLLAISALLSGAVSGAITQNKVDFLVGIFVFPVTSVISAFVFGSFIYYFFAFFRAMKLDFRRLMSLVSVAVVPYFLFHSVSSYLAPVDLMGFAFTCFLLIIGLVEQFTLDRKTVSRLVSAIALLFFIAWSIALIRNSYQG